MDGYDELLIFYEYELINIFSYKYESINILFEAKEGIQRKVEAV